MFTELRTEEVRTKEFSENLIFHWQVYETQPRGIKQILASCKKYVCQFTASNLIYLCIKKIKKCDNGCKDFTIH